MIRKAFKSVEPVEDALSGALMNAGPILVELLATSADDEDAAGE